MTTTQRTSIGAVLALAIATGAAPASARPFDLNANGSSVPAGAASMQARGAEASDPVNPPAPATVVRFVARSSGFDWGDAGIGAAGGLALSMVGVGGALALSQHRTRHTATTRP
jgi:hypothetical protein